MTDALNMAIQELRAAECPRAALDTLRTMKMFKEAPSQQWTTALQDLKAKNMPCFDFPAAIEKALEACPRGTDVATFKDNFRTWTFDRPESLGPLLWAMTAELIRQAEVERARREDRKSELLKEQRQADQAKEIAKESAKAARVDIQQEVNPLAELVGRNMANCKLSLEMRRDLGVDAEQATAKGQRTRAALSHDQQQIVNAIVAQGDQIINFKALGGVTVAGQEQAWQDILHIGCCYVREALGLKYDDAAMKKDLTGPPSKFVKVEEKKEERKFVPGRTVGTTPTAGTTPVKEGDSAKKEKKFCTRCGLSSHETDKCFTNLQELQCMRCQAFGHASSICPTKTK